MYAKSSTALYNSSSVSYLCRLISSFLSVLKYRSLMTLRQTFYRRLGFFEDEKDIEFNDVHYDLFALKKITEEQIEQYLEIVEDALFSNIA